MTTPSAPPSLPGAAGLSDAARALLDLRAVHRRERPGAIPRRAAAMIAPLSLYQRRLWLFDQVHPGSSAYNRPRAFRITGPLDVAALERALAAVAARHEVLRSALLFEDGGPVQRVSDPAFALGVIDLRAPASNVDAARHDALVRDEARRPFDLAAGSLIRATLLRLGDEEHTLAITLHHAASDGWSDAVLFREIGTAYEAFVAGTELPLPPLQLQYGDYAAWQGDRLASGALADDVAYWAERLVDAPASLDLPTDRSRPAEQSFDGSTRTLHIPAADVGALTELAREEKATLAMALLAVYEVLLARYSGQADFVVGVPAAGRTRPELEPLIGFFSNTLPVRADVSGEPSFRELLRRVRATSLAAYAHQDVPVDAVFEAMRARAPDAPTLSMMQVMLNVRNTPAQPLSLAGARVEPMSLAAGRADVDLDLEITERDDGLACVAEFATALFDDATIDRMLGHFAQLLVSAAAMPDIPVSRLPILSETERERTVSTWNATERALGSDTTLQALIDAQAARTPIAIAVSDERGSVTYAELVARADVVACDLQGRGVRPGALVGVCMERSVGLVVALLAVVKAGGAYVPLDPAFPADRLAFLIDDARPAVLIADGASVDRIPPGHAECLVLDEIDWSAAARVRPQPLATPDDLAYVIYTSGSTGRPKGVLNTHRGIANRILWMQTECPLSGDDAVLQKTPFSFDVSVPEIFGPLACGARLVMARPDGHLDDAYLARIIDDEAITSVHFVPSMLHRFLGEAALGAGRTLRYIFCSGEALPLPVARAVAGRFPQARLYNLYGPTEAAVEVSYWRFDPWSTRTVVPMGRPIANVRLYVLDASMQPVPAGVAGELYIGGVAVARGYLNRPELTAERFVPDPFAGDVAARLYRTGDVVRQDADGVIEYLGRTDHQVKIQGVRIECGEIEAVLLEHEQVRECIVSTIEASPGERRLVAHVVPHGGRDAVDDPSLRDFLRARLPEVLIPAAFVRLDAFPLTASGKTDRRALPAPVLGSGAERVAYRMPRTPTEVMLARLWSDVLGVERVGVHDDFFALGGNSLAAARIAGRVRALLDVTIPIRAIFEHPTIGALALVIAAKDHIPREPIVRMQRGDPAQAPLFLLHGDFNGGGLYCRALVRHLGSSRPVYTLYPHEPGSRDSIEEMAADYAERIRRTAPGPYLLAGYCNGAAVAYAIACRLRDRGEDVKLVALIDAAAPHRVLAALHGIVHGAARIAGVDVDRARDVYCRARDHVFQLSDLLPAREPRPSIPQWLASFGRIARSTVTAATRYAVRRAMRMRGAGRATEPAAAPVPTSEAAALFNQRWTWYIARVRDYSPRRFDGRITLIQPSARVRRRSEDATFNWSRVARDVDLHVVPGTHLTIVGDGLDVLGATLRASIEGAIGPA